MDRDLFLAILALGSYNREHGAGAVLSGVLDDQGPPLFRPTERAIVIEDMETRH